MKNEFIDEFFETRDSSLDDIKKNSYSWNKFINYWSKILDKYSVDNVLNLYFYNPYGKTFMTFDEWNSDEIDRRIKPKSKGIPIIDDNNKIYVFELRQTYGKEYKQWSYNHLVDDVILDYYNNKFDIDNDKNLFLNNKFFNIFYQMSKEQILNNYIDMNENEVEFIAKTMTSLLLSKTNFNINDLPNAHDILDNLDNEEILKCMQISNKETAILYDDFQKNAISLVLIQNDIQDNLLKQYKNDNLMNDEDRSKYLDMIQIQSGYDYEILDSIYENYLNKYKYYFPKRDSKVAMYIRTNNDSNNKELEQISLFTPREDELADKICDIFNSFDTKYQNTFEVSNIELQRWEHIKSKKRNLSIILTSSLVDGIADREKSFTYFNSDKTDEKKLNESLLNNAFIQSLYKDKDFSISFTPNMIHIYWNNFDDKQFDLSIPSTKLVDQEEIDSQELEKVDTEVSAISNDNDIDYVVENTEVIPSRNVVEEHSYNRNREIEEYPKVNYHISDDKIDTSFGAKSRFEDNIKAIELLKKLEREDRNATKEEQDILSRYVGWGGIADAFDERKENWKDERERLKLLLNDEEYKDASHSTLSSFYTPNIAIDGIYKALKQFGFEKGNILEPSMGIGNFFGRLPNEFEKSKLYGIELDSISGRIAKKLYPNAKIEITGYENSKVADELFDIAIGNVPFGNNSVFDRRYKEKFLIHDYFFQKTLDKVRNGGIIAFITTDGTLDKKDTKVREYIAKRAELLGAIRLPNNTFTGNANTKVTTDIIFLRKRDELKLDISDENWIYTSEFDDGITINNYYINNPDMMLGKMELQTTQFGYDNTLNPIDENINVLMDKAISNLPNNIFEQVNYEMNDSNYDYEVLSADESIKNYGFTVINKDGKDIIYRRVYSDLVPYSIQDGMVAKRIIGLCKVKNALREVFDVQLRDGSDEELTKAQQELDKIYNEFTKKYGYINDSVNARAFDSDPDYYLLTSIENKISKDEEDDKPQYEKGDVFTKRTIRKSKEIIRAKNAEDALKYSLNNRGCVDFEYMKKLYSKEENEIIEELDNLIYQDPSRLNESNNGWVIASEYLSGNVKQKLKFAKSVNVDNKFNKNIEALEKVQPG